MQMSLLVSYNFCRQAFNILQYLLSIDYSLPTNNDTDALSATGRVGETDGLTKVLIIWHWFSL